MEGLAWFIIVVFFMSWRLFGPKWSAVNTFAEARSLGSYHILFGLFFPPCGYKTILALVRNNT